MNPIETRLLGIIREVLPRRSRKMELNSALRLKQDLSIDYMATVLFIARVEETFEVDLVGHLEGHIHEIQTIGDVLERVGPLVEEGQ